MEHFGFIDSMNELSRLSLAVQSRVLILGFRGSVDLPWSEWELT
jgi:hypothetical protein